jgi:type I restriction enzyme M protein
LREAAADLCRIFDDPDEARRYFAVVDKAEIEENEFNLNLPRYVDTFEPEKLVSLDEAVNNLHIIRDECEMAMKQLDQLLARLQQ